MGPLFWSDVRIALYDGSRNEFPDRIDPKKDLLEDLKNVKPSILIAVPQVYKVYDGIHNKMAEQNAS